MQTATNDKRMRDAFLEGICEAMRRDERIFLLSADFGSPVLDSLKLSYPARFLNVGIAEQNLVNVAAGLALEGFTVIAYAIAPFLSMRCFEQIRVNLALLSQLRRMNVCLAAVGAGLSYDISGPTHQALEDLAIIRALPNIVLYSPADALSAHTLARVVTDRPGCKYVRLDGKGLPALYQTEDALDFERGFTVLRNGSDAAIIGTGYMTHAALAAAELLFDAGLQSKVIDFYGLSCYDKGAVADELRSIPVILTLEEGFCGKGGLDCLILNILAEYQIHSIFKGVGLEGGYAFETGTREQSLKKRNLDPLSIANTVMQLVKRKT